MDTTRRCCRRTEPGRRRTRPPTSSPVCEPGQRLLDVGCGPGTITADLAALVAPGEVVALEREASILDEAMAVASERGLTNITPMVGDVYALDLQPMTASMWFTPTRSSSTWPTRWRPWSRWGG